MSEHETGGERCAHCGQSVDMRRPHRLAAYHPRCARDGYVITSDSAEARIRDLEKALDTALYHWQASNDEFEGSTTGINAANGEARPVPPRPLRGEAMSTPTADQIRAIVREELERCLANRADGATSAAPTNTESDGDLSSIPPEVMEDVRRTVAHLRRSRRQRRGSAASAKPSPPTVARSKTP